MDLCRIFERVTDAEFAAQSPASLHSGEIADKAEKFLMELGIGFMFAGSQYRLVVGGDELFIDLLF